MTETVKRRETRLETIDLINSGLYKNELAYANARTIADVFIELKSVRNVCADLVNQGPADGEYAPRINPELIVEWMDGALDTLEKQHNKTLESVPSKKHVLIPKTETKELTMSAWAVI